MRRQDQAQHTTHLVTVGLTKEHESRQALFGFIFVLLFPWLLSLAFACPILFCILRFGFGLCLAFLGGLVLAGVWRGRCFVLGLLLRQVQPAKLAKTAMSQER